MDTNNPPAGTGNPLGLAGGYARLGPCMAGRVIQKEEWPWNEPCAAAAQGILTLHGDEDDQVLIPLCIWHQDLLVEAGVSTEDPPDEPS